MHVKEWITMGKLHFNIHYNFQIYMLYETHNLDLFITISTTEKAEL